MDAGFSELFAVEPQRGTVVASTIAAAEGKPKVGQAFFESGKSGLYLQMPHFPAEGGAMEMMAGIPLRTPDGRLVAVLAGRLNLAAMNTIVQRRTGLDQTDEYLLVNADGFLVSKPRSLPEGSRARQKLDTEIVRRCIAGNSGAGLALDYRGVPVIATYRWNAKRQLGLIVKIDQAEAIAPAHAFGRSVLMISGLALLATAALALLLARTITRPLRALHASVTHFADGHIEKPLPESSGDELGLLAREFNRMQARIRQRTDELAETNETLRVLFDLMPAMIWFKDLEDRMIRVNRRVADAAGLPIEEIEGKHSVEIYPHEAAKYHADDLEVIESGAPKLGIVETLRTSQGLEMCVQTDKVPVRDKDGKVIGIIVMAQDITVRKRAEESVRLLSSAVEQSRESIMITDAELGFPGPNIIFVNPAFTRMTGYSAEEAIGKTPQILEGPGTDKAVLTALRQQLQRGEGSEGEGVHYRKDGTEFDVEWQITPIRNSRGELTHFVSIQRDITERKRAERAVETLNKELHDASRRAGMAEVATGVLHNVGNVLNSINVSTSLVVERLQKSRVSRLSEVAKLLSEHQADLSAFLTGDERGRKLPEFLAQLAVHLSRETQQIAEEMQAVAGNVEHIKEIVATQQSYAGSFGVLEPLDVRDAIEDALRIHGGALNRHDIQIVRMLEPVPTVLVDKHKVLQILVNLISNAKYAMTDSPVKTLTIKTYPSAEGGIQISVHDTGCGIVAENITRIFAHGFTTKKQGHGFGLHSSALAAKEMNALLIADSDGAAQGAVFTLVFPPAIPAQLAA
jgi:PAS domain S-box-containing protein